ncbi:MAG: hypothetical protein GC159_17400 [Phycisphaera sp.]|nr:hypothetical protein [Phycisphaera sp.]
MTDLLQHGSDWLEDQRTRHMTRAVQYTRPSDATATVLNATVGQTSFRLADEYGAVIRHVSRDYVFLAAALVLNGVPTEPKRGDQIKEVVDGFMLTYEVMGPGGDEPDWRYSDAYSKAIRVHTKLVSKEAA